MTGPDLLSLSALTTEEEDRYVVQRRMHNDGICNPGSGAWGEEVADSIKSAAEIIAGRAERFSIPQNRIILGLRMEDIAENTPH
jgi:hypothetical protein